MNLLLLIAIVIVCLVLAFIAIDYLGSAAGGDGRLYGLLKVVAVLIALLFLLKRSGLL